MHERCCPLLSDKQTAALLMLASCVPEAVKFSDQGVGLAHGLALTFLSSCYCPQPAVTKEC
eukprot:7665605-Pyramimonas_sp.AAC.1